MGTVRIGSWAGALGRAGTEACRRQPLVAAGALFVAGVACGYRCGAPAALAAAALAALAALALRRSRAWGAWSAPALGALAALGLGWARAAWDAAGREAEAARLGAAPRVDVICEVGAAVEVRTTSGAGAKRTFAARRVRLASGGRVRYLPVEVAWYGVREERPGPVPRPGEVWRLAGRPAVRRGRDGLPALLLNSGEERSERLEPAGRASWVSRVERARREAVRRVTLGIEDWGALPALNQAMLLGCRNEMPRAMRRVFADSGTIHVFAISGLHIALVAGVLVALVKAAGVPRLWWVAAVGPVLVFYTLTTGARPSAVRACLMALLVFLAPLLGRRPNGLTALAGTALLVHAFEPALVFDVGSILSFTVMAGLVVFCRPFCALGQRLCGVGRLRQQAGLCECAGDAAQGARLRRRAAALRLAADTAAVSLAAWLTSVPLTAHYFGRFTPGGLAANLVVAPCSLLTVVSGCLGLAASFVSAGAASCFNHAAGFFTLVMVRTAERTAACPWGTFRVARWAPWQVALWFAALALLAAALHARRPSTGLEWLETEAGEP